jgi:hypothetical protein
MATPERTRASGNVIVEYLVSPFQVLTMEHKGGFHADGALKRTIGAIRYFVLHFQSFRKESMSLTFFAIALNHLDFIHV